MLSSDMGQWCVVMVYVVVSGGNCASNESNLGLEL